MTSLSLFTLMHWRRKWQHTPVFLPGESQGWESLVGCHLWGRTESDTTEATQQQQQHTDSASVSPFHQEASISLLSFSIRGQTHCHHTHRKLVNLITWTTDLSNSMKLSHARGATQDGQVMVERSDRMWATVEENGKPLQYACLQNPMNSMKRQNDST